MTYQLAFKMKNGSAINLDYTDLDALVEDLTTVDADEEVASKAITCKESGAYFFRDGDRPLAPIAFLLKEGQR